MGWGAAAGVINDMRRAARQERRAADGARAVRMAMREAKRAARLAGGPEDDDDPIENGFRLCMNCRHFDPPPSELAHLRGVAPDERQRCSACGNEGLLNLGDPQMVEQLHELDEYEGARRSEGPLRWARVVVLGIISSILTLVALVLIGLFVHSLANSGGRVHGFSLFFVLMMLAIPVAAFVLIRRTVEAWRDARPMRVPGRWSFRTPSSATIEAPLTGRSCRAYEVAIREADARMGGDTQWLLLDRCVAEGDKLPTTREQLDTSEALTAQVRAYMVARGVDINDDLAVYETILPAS